MHLNFENLLRIILQKNDEIKCKISILNLVMVLMFSFIAIAVIPNW